jgi:hypothetical protein
MPNTSPPHYNSATENEGRISAALQTLQTLLNQRNEAGNQQDQATVRQVERQIPAAMRRIGDAYLLSANTETYQNWYRQAEEFERANPEEREHILMPIAKGLGLLIAAPLALAFGIVGGAVFTAGSILYGVGKVVQGLGSLFTGGLFDK